MAIRNVLTKEEAALYKKSRIITKFDDRLHQLLDDMADTLIESNGVGLAAPQVGILRRAVLVLETNVAEDEDEYIIELINPEIIETAGEEEGPEGCLSVPGEYGLVVRPTYVKVRAQDRFGEWFEVEGEGLTARAFCHEIDHLDGHLFTEFAKELMTEKELSELAEEEELEEE